MINNKKFGLIGERLGHTFSPIIHREILKHINIQGQYEVLEFEKDYLPNIIDNLKYGAYKGINVTIPYKTDIIPYLDEISSEAEKIGAVNTISFSGDKAIGYNTDYFGFGKLLDFHKIDVRQKTALILGTGGASRAVSRYLEDNYIKSIKFASTNPEQSKNKYCGYEIYSYDELNQIEKTDIIINCTPVGMFKDKDKTPVDKSYLTKFSVIIDLIYNPIETTLLIQARKLGLKTANGLYMLTAQAVKSQEIWNDVIIDDSIIDKINTLLIKEISLK